MTLSRAEQSCQGPAATSLLMWHRALETRQGYRRNAQQTLKLETTKMTSQTRPACPQRKYITGVGSATRAALHIGDLFGASSEVIHV